MKKADIKTDGTAYLAKVSYNSSAPVVPIKVGVARERGRNVTADGVCVRLPHPTRVEYKLYPEGAEVVLSSRAIEREWTGLDERKRLDAIEANQRADDLRDRFEAVGFDASRTRRYRKDEPELDAFVTPQGVTLTLAAAERLLGMVTT